MGLSVCLIGLIGTMDQGRQKSGRDQSSSFTYLRIPRHYGRGIVRGMMCVAREVNCHPTFKDLRIC